MRTLRLKESTRSPFREGMWQFVEGSHGSTPQLVARLSQRIDRLPLHVIDCAEIRLELLQLAIDYVVAQLAVESQRTTEN